MKIIKIVLLILFPFTLFAQSSQSPFDAYMEGQAALYRFNGNVLVANKGKIIYEKSFGYVDYNSGKPLDKNTLFDIGSITKEFTSVGILLLKDRGKISLDDTLRKFFPELPYSNITIAQLLTHTSGMPEGFDIIEKYFDHSKVAANRDLIQLLANYQPPLLFKPGENLMYSGTAFNLLASIIEKVSAQSYNTFLKENIFLRLAMKSTMVANYVRNDTKIKNLAKGFYFVDSTKSYENAEDIFPNWSTYFSGINGEGMIISTTEDLLKWDRALKNHQVLSEQTQKDMVTVHAEKKSIPIIKFGYGIRVETSELGECIFHNGWYPGFKSMLVRYTGDDITVIVLSNNESQSEFIADGLAAISMEKQIVMPYSHIEMNQFTTLDKFTGKFMMPLTRPPYMANFPVEIINKNNNLFLYGPGVPGIQLKPESATKFFYTDGTDQQIEFILTREGDVSNVFYTGYGLRKEIKRLN